MKRFFAFLSVLFIFCSCSISDDGPDYYYEFVPIESVEMPSSMIVNNVYEIIMTYERPNSCYIYNDIYYSHDDDTTRTVALICSVYNSSSFGCEPLDNPEHNASFNFKPTLIGDYTFKFWHGEDENEEDLYLTVNVTVTE